MSLNANDYQVNMNDDRLTAIKTQEEQSKNDLNNTYNSMINNTDKFYQDQVQASKDYSKQQEASQNAKTQQSINEINQQKEQTQADYTKEQKGSYNDYMQQINPYGNQAEKIASMGIQNSGVSESANTSMYNTYQNRVATARDTLNKTNMNFDNKISEAKLSNNTAIADIYANAAKDQAQTLLQGFQYKNTLIQTKTNQLTELGNRYDTKYLNMYNQINNEMQSKKETDEYNEKMELQRKEDEEKQQEYIQNLQLQQQELEIKRASAKTQDDYYKSLIRKANASTSSYKTVSNSASNNVSTSTFNKDNFINSMQQQINALNNVQYDSNKDRASELKSKARNLIRLQYKNGNISSDEASNLINSIS